jgi:hypothetical protein
MKVWWVLSVILITLTLAVFIIAGSVPFVFQAVSVVCVALWVIALLYFIVRRW